MNLQPLLQPIRELPAYQKLLQHLEAGTVPVSSAQLPKASRAATIAGLAGDLNIPLLVLVARGDRLLTLSEELSAWDPSLEVLVCPEPNPLFYEKAPWGRRAKRERAATLARLTAAIQPGGKDQAADPPDVVLATGRATMTRSLPRRDFLANSRWLHAGSQRRPDQLIQLLVDTGYQPNTVVSQPGQFSRRGGILDLWPPAEDSPVRLEFFGDEIDSMRYFDPASQRSMSAVESLRVTPAREGLPSHFEAPWVELLPEEAHQTSPGDPQEPYLEFFIPWMHPAAPAGLLDYVPADAILLIEDRMSLEAALDDLEAQAVEFRQEQIEQGMLSADAPIPYVTRPEIEDQLRSATSLDLGYGAAALEDPETLGDRFQTGLRFGGGLQPLMRHLSQRQQAHEPTILVSRQAPRLAELWQQEAASAPLLETPPTPLVPGEVVFIKGALAEGWTLTTPDGDIHLLTDAEIFGWARPQPRRRKPRRVQAPEAGYADLEPGDFVVHIDYGIGRFSGLVERTLAGLQREYLLLEYASGGQVYVPVHQADRITRYVGVDGSEPDLARLGTTEWERVRERAERAVEEIARDLLELYAKRSTVQGHAYSEDTPWQRELEASFPYMETEDQLQAIEAVKQDMEQPQPMDRLICGDVGYGKTEVALRAAFKAVMDNRQVAMLVPTTILAQQHFNTFRERLSAYPVAVEMLSRFRTAAESREVLARLSAGEVDIVIGTHRLLQPDVEFHKLGLLIIDEEQRFGVTHKEHLKQMRTEVDVLTMTATPIPRTLYMALTGVRDISTIDTPPEERLPVITHVGRYEPRLVRQAILREHDRGGQVFFVHNRVQTIQRTRERLGRLVPEVVLEVAHGQMPERELSSVMERFAAGQIDVLVTTSIIESGLDIPNANTLIVDRADTFGLAQLYQLRGRVGRGPVRAFAYFFRQAHGRATEEALQRLEVIAEHTQLGAGYSIAMRDLEIRGAGDILGTRQSGQIAAVGFHLYTRLLGAAVRRLRQQEGAALPDSAALPSAQSPLDVSVELPLASALPPDYIQNRQLRLQLYRRMAELRSLEALEALREEMTDRFGPPPEEVANLLYQLRVKVKAAQASVRSVSTENGQILLQLAGPEGRELPANLGPDVRQSKRGIWLARGGEQDWPGRLLDLLDRMQVAQAV
ncbi:MAG: transcription-repair coupling factor [Anaerolineales bacterium]